MDKRAKTTEARELPCFSEILRKIHLPEGVDLELCIVSIASRNDCSTNCRPLVLEAIQHKEFLEKSIREALGFENKALTKILLYSALYDFGIKRPENKEDFISKVDLIGMKDSVLFLMAGNQPQHKG
jgi:hypothetical protein